MMFEVNRALMTVLLVAGHSAVAAPSVSNPPTMVSEVSNNYAAEITAPTIEISPPSQSRLADLVIHAISLIGVKYKFGGGSAQSGFDCSGFVRHVFAQALALELPRSSYAMGRLGVTVESNELSPGDLVFFNTLRRSYSHVGIYVGEGRFVHAPSRGKQVEIVDMSDNYWKKRFNGARRLISE